MSEIRIGTLCSGSKGNSTLVAYKDTAVLIDAGRSTKYLRDALASINMTPDQINAVFLTHSHTDHTSALKVWTSRYSTPVHATAPVCSAVLSRCEEGILVSHPIVFECAIGDIIVKSFPTDHDSLGSVGYCFSFVGDERRVGIATDLGSVTEQVSNGLCGCVAAVIESNHNVEMLLNGPYPPDLKQRILSRFGHLSNESGAELAEYLANNGAKALLLAHLSEINNTPELAHRASSELLSKFGDSVSLEIAHPAHPVIITL